MTCCFSCQHIPHNTECTISFTQRLLCSWHCIKSHVIRIRAKYSGPFERVATTPCIFCNCLHSCLLLPYDLVVPSTQSNKGEHNKAFTTPHLHRTDDESNLCHTTTPKGRSHGVINWCFIKWTSCPPSSNSSDCFPLNIWDKELLTSTFKLQLSASISSK